MGAGTIEATDETFDTEVTQHQGLTLVDFWGYGCPPCKMLAPVLDELAAELGPKVKVVKINVHDNTEAGSRYGILSIPQLVLFRNGQEIDRSAGYSPKAKLKPWVEGNVK